jgi:hypothetical protein
MFRSITPIIERLNLDPTLHPTCPELESKTTKVIKESRRIGDSFFINGYLAARIISVNLTLLNFMYPDVVIFEKRPDKQIPKDIKKYIGANNGFTIFNGQWYALKHNEDDTWTPTRKIDLSFRPFGILDPYRNVFDVESVSQIEERIMSQAFTYE